MATGEVLYAAYGDMERILPVLLDRDLPSGISVIMHDVELCMQTLHDAPDEVFDTAPAPVSAQTILRETWDEEDEFSTYVVRPAAGKDTPGRLHEVTAEEHELIQDFNLAPFSWLVPYAVRVTSIDAKRQPSGLVVTDAIDPRQPAEPIHSFGRVAQAPLNGEKSLEVAASVRREFLNRSAA